ncbi:MAG: aspartate/glutamate racemase family protein [Rhodobacteraceae bacterium]|nr:aspartate/glutamate racemase family protein [Paracoccaceae bacterium]
MRIVLINPNSTASMTDQVRESARRNAFPGTEIVALNPADTPASIEGHADEALSVPALLQAIRTAEAGGGDAFVIACFDDPGLAAAREVARGPVIGICQAAVQVATTIAARFSIVTTLPRSVPIIEDLVHHYGAAAKCRSVRAIDMPVLALEAEPDLAEARLVAEIEAARDRDGAEAVVLGCAGMSELCERLSERTGMPVIDGVSAAVKLAEALIGGGYRTSKVGAYNYPTVKDRAACPMEDCA